VEVLKQYMMENINLAEIESVISDYIFKKNGVRIGVDILKGIPKDSMIAKHPMLQAVAAAKINQATEIYHMILFNERKKNEKE